jgi:uncharacterized protein YhbP (UPF0306 family)
MKNLLTKRIILEFLQQHKLMFVATQGEHPWIASVFYTFDNDLNLYFLSNPETLHSKHIVKNKEVAVAIADSHQQLNDLKKGVQIYGHVKQISDLHKMKHAIDLWKNSLGYNGSEISYENIINKVIKGRMYKIQPKKIKFFNQELFDVEDGKEPVLEF